MTFPRHVDLRTGQGRAVAAMRPSASRANGTPQLLQNGQPASQNLPSSHDNAPSLISPPRSRVRAQEKVVYARAAGAPRILFKAAPIGEAFRRCSEPAT